MSPIRRTVAVAAAAALSMPALVLVSANDAQAADPVTHEDNVRVPEGAAWTEAYFPSAGGVQLHADVLRPAHLPAKAKTPVILSVSSYFAHAGATSNDGYEAVGPSERFRDLVDGAELMKKGYTVVMVDLRGFGGSTGCLDWVGPGEQADIATAVNWAKSRPWSTGKVGMYGKSYDASTGLAGAAMRTPGLEAVVAQEPVWDMYQYLWQNGVPRWNHRDTPSSYNGIATIDPMADDTARYAKNAKYEERNPECLTNNMNNNQNPDPNSDYWKARNLAANVKGSKVPIFVTQGTIEPNTMPEDMETFLKNHRGEQRGWIGPFDHIRGNDTDASGRLLMGRSGWFDEVMRFYDKHLKGIEPKVKDPNWVVQDNSGTWREEKTWPNSAVTQDISLSTGSYVDTGKAPRVASQSSAAKRRQGDPRGQADMENMPSMAPVRALGLPRASDGAGRSPISSALNTWSKPVKKATRLTGTPVVKLRTTGSGTATTSLWDIGPDGTGVPINDMIVTLDASGRTKYELRSMDWTLEPGHQLAVTVGTDAEGDLWDGERTGERITVKSASLALPLQNPAKDKATQGSRAPYLDRYLTSNTVEGLTTQGGTYSLDFRP
ncbi:CocE/NonD family hydrolase [Demetria terragena]|uniref:CocE/NonD family hydrolase n=1 Tax=Demetria terragena TaxID=63959 RepID=UPI000372BDB0|nr:CocE/NonD family hydrolase [Demetria terragena]